ncbi:hypothetical protein P8452_25358 [Trifolium repens]|nr:hypothetical protein P8452_25358 [Trifolium repens]
MAMFIDKGSEIELEAFLVTWLGNTIALAPAVLAFEDCLNSSLPPNHNTLTPSISVDDCKHVLEDDANESKIARLSSDRICHSETQTESYSYLSEASVAALEQSISRLERVRAKLKNDRLGLS